MRVSTILGTTVALTTSIWGVVPATKAMHLAEGTTSFQKPPSLINATTTYNQTNMWGATYYFTLELPENAGESLQRVTINQRQGIDDIRFEVKETRAFEGTPQHKGERLTLSEVTNDAETKTISVKFEPPVTPGKTFTIALHPVRNPSVGGAYIFGVTAFPAVEKPYGLYLGVGRLQFYDNDRIFPINYRWWRR